MFSTDFLITSLVVVLIPGTGVIYTVSSGLFSGWRASIAAAVGCTAGILPHLAASALGLSTLLHLSALAFQVLKYAGTVYLLYLAWSMWRARGVLALNRPSHGNGLLNIAGRGIVLNILNPKLSMFFWAFLPQFISQNAISPLQQMVVLSAVFMLMTLVIFILYGVLASGVSLCLTSSPNAVLWLQRSFAAIFAVLAAKLALSEQ